MAKMKLPTTNLRGAGVVVAIMLLLLAAMGLMSHATQDSARFGASYSQLLIFTALGLSTLAVVIGLNVWKVVRQARSREAGGRLTLRMAGIFVILALTPLVVVYGFSLQVLHRGIDSWFDVRIETALSDALELGRTSLGVRMREQLRQTEAIADNLASVPVENLALALGSEMAETSAVELTVLSSSGAILASSSVDQTNLVPRQTDGAVLLHLNDTSSSVSLDPVGDSGLYVRAVVELSNRDAVGTRIFLQALFPVAERMNELAQTVHAAYAKYRELAYLRDPLKFSFTLTLSLVLLLAVFAAVWSAFFSARRMVAPLRSLAEATEAVAAGDLTTRLTQRAQQDELGFLMSSFNDMTARLQQARDETRLSQAQVEEQRAYLEAVLARMSSGMITLDAKQHVVTVNAAAAQILGVEQTDLNACSLPDLAITQPRLQPLVDVLDAHFATTDKDWRAELTLFGPSGRQVLVCRGTLLPVSDEIHTGHIVVFDDMTALIQGQRNAAWSEVARRLAHEIKNPLTPIQLSAERLRHKYLKQMPADDGASLDRLTRTIVNQVESMKDMVNAFSDYARSPATKPRPLDLNGLVADVAALYGHKIVRTELEPDLPQVDADPDRLRQVLHNLIKNAEEAMGEAHEEDACVTLLTSLKAQGQASHVELEVRDQGPGIPEEIAATLFEPYVTHKPRGTGLGLAIVKKIVEEHGGLVWAEGNPAGGASMMIQLPLSEISVPAARSGVQS
jgi:PAS domain S-box-containing protein